MARYPDWLARLDAITDALRSADRLEWLGRNEIKAIFGCSERDSIRLLHKFGAEERDNALSLPRSALLAQLEAIRSSSTYSRFLSQQQDVAKQLVAARSEAAARQFRVSPVPVAERPSLENLPATITWRRRSAGPGRFEVLYSDGADLMRQIAEFLTAAGANRDEFFASTDAARDAGH